MILVDTSVLVDFLKGNETRAAEELDRALARDNEIVLAPEVVQEVLQGARDESEWRTLKRYLASQTVVRSRNPLATHLAAARIFVDCRRRGLAVRSSVDCLIAQRALEAGLPLLHDDRDYEAIRQVRPLKTLPSPRTS